MFTEIVKVCGAKVVEDIDLLHECDVDLVGLWHGTSGGRNELTLDSLEQLARRARDSSVEPVLVTFLASPSELSAVLLRTQIGYVQLHAYQAPHVVARLKELAPSSTVVIKVLHIVDGACLELRFIPRYEKAGVDVFLIDSTTRERVGSTGHQLDEVAAGRVAERSTVPFMLAGGLSAENCGRFDALRCHPRFGGADFDTYARGQDGRFDRTRVVRIVDSWRRPVPTANRVSWWGEGEAPRDR